MVRLLIAIIYDADTLEDLAKLESAQLACTRALANAGGVRAHTYKARTIQTQAHQPANNSATLVKDAS